MIARVWKGITRPGQGETYLEHLRSSVVPELQQIDGFSGVEVMRGRDNPEEFVVITTWRSMAAISRFAGEDATRAVVAPAAAALLAHADDRAVHYEVALRT